MGNELEEKLGAILSDPEIMRKLQSIAGSLRQEPADTPDASAPGRTGLQDAAILQTLSGLAGKTGIDAREQALLSALTPYLSQLRVAKLENAMRAAKMARLASSFLGSGGLQQLMGR